MKFVLRSAAREDILRQYEYYLTEADAVIAARFLTAVQSAIGQICRQPGIGAPKMLESRTLAGLSKVSQISDCITWFRGQRFVSSGWCMVRGT
jgi:plasmid stabilization system protein ParE